MNLLLPSREWLADFTKVVRVKGVSKPNCNR